MNFFGQAAYMWRLAEALVLLAMLLPPLSKAAGVDQAVAAAAASVADSCGVVGVLDAAAGIFKPSVSKEPICDAMMITDCSVTYASMRCPSDCGYLVPNHAFSCVFQCVSAVNCSASNPNRALPDAESGMCLTCDVDSCKRCSGQDTCLECHAGFELSADGTSCVFTLDTWMKLDVVVSVIGVLLGLILFLAVVWHARHGAHPKLAENLDAIMRARRNRHMVKVQDWQLGNPKWVRKRYPLSINVHEQNIIGVGLPLYYNSICFLMIVALLFLTFTSAVYKGTSAAKVLARFEHDDTILLDNAEVPIKAYPARVISELSVCPNALGDVRQGLLKFADANFVAIGLLYVATFCISLAYVRFQKWHCMWFDKKNSTMADYAIRIRGLPVEQTDEETLRAWLEAEFRKSCPKLLNRPRKLDLGSSSVDGYVTPEESYSQVEVHGVSICYDYSKERDAVERAMWRLMERMEIQMAKREFKVMRARLPKERAPKAPALEAKHTSAGDDETLNDVAMEDQALASSWFEGDSKLRSTGEAFVVFKYIGDKELILKAYNDKTLVLEPPRSWRQGSETPERPVEMFNVFSEPPAIQWWHIAIQPAMIRNNTACTVLKVLAFVLVVQVFLVYPYAHYIVWPYSRTGSAAAGTKMTIAGIVLGNINMFVGIVIFQSAYGLGYHRKDLMDIMIFYCNTGLVMINTLFNIYNMAYMVFSRNDFHSGLEVFLAVKSMVHIGTENVLAQNLYNMLVPGTFFTGYFMLIVMAGLVPYVWSSFLMKIIYVWRCLPTPMLEILRMFLPWAPPTLDNYPYMHAEKGLEPMEIGLAWDYSSNIVFPTMCFSMLFFMSPYVWKTFFAMFAWALFYYLFCRFLHLRFQKANYHTTFRLDSSVNYAWGIPLSVIAAAWCAWGWRSSAFGREVPVEVKVLSVAGAFVFSLLLWLLTYHFLIDPSGITDADEEKKEVTVSDVQEDTLYSWFNCNPVYVLKCEYHFRTQGEHAEHGEQDEHGARRSYNTGGQQPIACGEDPYQVRAFQVGKEYLFLKIGKLPLLQQDHRNYLEFETYLEIILGVWGKLLELFQKRAHHREDRARLPNLIRSSGSQQALLESLEGLVEDVKNAVKELQEVDPDLHDKGDLVQVKSIGTIDSSDSLVQSSTKTTGSQIPLLSLDMP